MKWMVLASALVAGCAGIGYSPDTGLPPGRCANPNDPTTSIPCPPKAANRPKASPEDGPSCDTIGFDKERCCKAGHGEHCYAQAETLKGVTPTDASAKRPQRLSYLRLGCDQAHAKSCLVLGEELIADKHEQEAVAPLQKACDAEEFKACLTLDGLGEPRSADPKKATASVKKQCDGGDDAACLAYASVIAKADPKGAMALRERTCSSKTSKLSKDVKATCLANIARAYESGDGVTSDTFRAYAYFEEACTAGHLGSCLKTAAKCEGEREAHQMTETASCYEAACKLGHADSCVLFGGGKVAPPASASGSAGPKAPAGKKSCEERCGDECMREAPSMLMQCHGQCTMAKCGK